MRRVHRDRALHDGRRVGLGRVHMHPHRLAQQARGQRLHGGREGGGEKQVLALGGQQDQHALQFVGEAQVEQAVRFVQHERDYVCQAQGVLFHQIQQAARRSHHDVGAAAQRHHLRIDRDAAEHHHGFHALQQVLRQAAHHLADLRSQLARGHQHQRAHAPRRVQRPCVQSLQQRQHERGRLAGAGGRRAQHVGPGQDGGHGLLLDRRGRGEAQLGGGLREFGREA